MKKILLLFTTTLLCTSTILAQNEREDRKIEEQKTITFAFQPLQLFNAGGLHIDIEKRLGNSPSWLQLGITGYPFFLGSFDEDSSYEGYLYTDRWYLWGHDFSYMGGINVNLNFKHFFNKAQSFYLAGGISYGYFNIKYWGNEWYSFQENGLEYHSIRYTKQQQEINKLGINTYFGYQIPNRSAFLFDMFVGLGYRYGIYNEDRCEFDESILAPGYRGVTFLTGVRIGLKY